MYRAEGANVVYIHDVDETEQVFLTVHPTVDCTKTPEEQAEVLAQRLNDRDDLQRAAHKARPKPAAIRIIRATGGQRMLKAHTGNGAAVQVKINLSQTDQKLLKPSEQETVVRALIKDALLEIAGKL